MNDDVFATSIDLFCQSNEYWKALLNVIGNEAWLHNNGNAIVTDLRNNEWNIIFHVNVNKEKQIFYPSTITIRAYRESSIQIDDVIKLRAVSNRARMSNSVPIFNVVFRNTVSKLEELNKSFYFKDCDYSSVTKYSQINSITFEVIYFGLVINITVKTP